MSNFIEMIVNRVMAYTEFDFSHGNALEGDIAAYVCCTQKGFGKEPKWCDTTHWLFLWPAQRNVLQDI